MLVFADPFALVDQDRIAGLLLLVAHTVRSEADDQIIRIISARRATRKERQRYDQSRAKTSIL